MSPDLVGYLESVVYGRRRGAAAAITRSVLNVLSLVYRAGLRAYLLPFDVGLRKRHRLPRPVISIGNVTVGGTGKTPTVQYVCRGLAARGLNPAVLSYGYGGTLHGRMGVVSDGEGVRLPAEEAGDEPVMLADSLPGVPVLVCKHRHQSGRTAVDDLGADLLVLDDGFQVWKLHRDFDIVLVNIHKPFDNGHTLPAGKLREPLSALRRADCIIATGDLPANGGDALGAIRLSCPEIPVFHGRFRPTAVVLLPNGPPVPIEQIKGKRVMALSGIGNPTSFESTLLEAGASIVHSERLPDHHTYSDADIRRVSRAAADRGAEMIATTEKDAVKLRAHELTLPVAAVRVELKLDDEEGFWELLNTRMEEVSPEDW